MKMEAGLDNGPVFCSEETDIRREDDFQALHDRLARLGADLLLRNLEPICAGSIIAEVQDETLCTYASKISNTETRIDWSQPAEQIMRLIKALAPAPGAHTIWRGAVLKVFKAEARACGAVSINPGQIQALYDGGIDVSCGNGMLMLREVQPAGKKRMPAADFLRGVSLQTGEYLGQ